MMHTKITNNVDAIFDELMKYVFMSEFFYNIVIHVISLAVVASQQRYN